MLITSVVLAVPMPMAAKSKRGAEPSISGTQPNLIDCSPYQVNPFAKFHEKPPATSCKTLLTKRQNDNYKFQANYAFQK